MIVPFPDGHFEGDSQRPLTKLMIASLLTPCANQKGKVPFNFKDAHGSFTALV